MTKEEIATGIFRVMLPTDGNDRLENFVGKEKAAAILKAMQEYSDLQNKELWSLVDELEANIKRSNNFLKEYMEHSRNVGLVKNTLSMIELNDRTLTKVKALKEGRKIG